MVRNHRSAAADLALHQLFLAPVGDTNPIDPDVPRALRAIREMAAVRRPNWIGIAPAFVVRRVVRPDDRSRSQTSQFPVCNTCFGHIPKTGGSWVTKGLHSAIPEEYRHEVPSADVGRVPLRWLLQQYVFVSGHFTMAEVSQVLHDTFVFTFLREPVDRVISLYHCYRQQPGGEALDPRAAQVQAQDFERFVETLTSRVSLWSNWHTYVLSGCAHCELPASDLLPGALAHLQQLDFVGVQDHLASGLAALAHLRNWTVTPPSGPVNVTRSRPTRDALPASVVRKLQELNDCDAELYAAALQRWHALQGQGEAPRPSVTVTRHWSHRREMGTREIEITSAITSWCTST